MQNDPRVRTIDAAEYLQIPLSAVQILLKIGLLQGEKMARGRNSHWRIRLSELDRFRDRLRTQE